jgi:ADP-ribose pyrophosphatase
MEILGTKTLLDLGNKARKFLSVHERTILHNGTERLYWFVSRGNVPAHADKKPDAVMIVPVWHGPDGTNKLVMTSEFRVAIAARELGFPAGLIDSTDYNDSMSVQDAAIKAARREMWEETGLDFEPGEVSPPNLYSSAGLTNESITIVLGKATGVPSAENLEESEDIKVLLLSHEDLVELVRSPDPQYAYSKTAWPFMWAMARHGF